VAEEGRMPSSSQGIRRVTACGAIVFAVGVIATPAVLHFREPEFGPLWRMISEYEIGRNGWMMGLAFFC
jgi:hypothetical protein